MGTHRRVLVGAAVVVLALLGVVGAGFATTHPVASSHIGALALPAGTLQTRLVLHGVSAPPDAFCREHFDSPCYSPQEIRHAYGLDSAIGAGDRGDGQTIVIIDSFGSPTIANDLATFDADYGLPNPPSLKVLAPLGPSPSFDPGNSDMVGWAAETTLDVEWAHAMAPSARIDLLTSPVSETEGVQGMPQFLALEKYALDNNLGQIISQSWGATENTLTGPQGQSVFSSFEELYARAAAHHVTVFASAGDTGSTNYELNLSTLYAKPVVGFPASSPLVTAVGGTSLFADTSGNYQSETVWNEGLDGGATGGGISQVFGEPDYQHALSPAIQALLGGHRGLPDISWNADPFTAVLIYLSFLGPDNAGYYGIGGTSEGAPQLAGMVADLNQLLGRPIGFLNPYLYKLGPTGIGFHDITVGNNSFNGVPGYEARPGWDAATGWGTPNVGQLFPALAKLAQMGG